MRGIPYVCKTGTVFLKLIFRTDEVTHVISGAKSIKRVPNVIRVTTL